MFINCDRLYTMNPRPKIFLVIYVITLILALFVVIPMGMISTDFNHKCLLYAKGTFTYDNQTNVSVFKLSTWPNSSNCNYVLFVGILWLLVSVSYIWSYSILVWKEHDRAPFGSFLVMIANGLVTFSSFVGALILSVGFESFCEGVYNIGRALTCSATDITFSFSPDDDINTYDYFSRIHVAQFGMWSGLCTWLIVTILSFFKVYYYHKNDDLLQSLAYEKETLLNRRRHYHQVQSDNDNTTPKV